LPSDEIASLAEGTPGWEVDGDKLTREFSFKDFNEAFGFLSRVAVLAEAESHHPDIFNSWNKVRLSFWTHTAEGLTRNDFIMAAKINAFAS
jgi:4a-hydroxytetrahydrobiopterin dehydratase